MYCGLKFTSLDKQICFRIPLDLALYSSLQKSWKKKRSEPLQMQILAITLYIPSSQVFKKGSFPFRIFANTSTKNYLLLQFSHTIINAFGEKRLNVFQKYLANFFSLEESRYLCTNWSKRRFMQIFCEHTKWKFSFQYTTLQHRFHY
jgi:hypothetical protein